MAPELEALATALHESAAEGSRGDLGTLAGQVAAMVRQLGAFSRRQLLPMGQVDLGQVVRRAEPTLHRIVGDYIAFSSDVTESGSVSAHAEDLEHLLTSLVVLGRDLLPAGGSVAVATRRHAEPRADEDGSVGGPQIVVSASGYGVLMPDRGLSVEQVVDRTGGELRISGEAGWGVRLEVTFPRCGRRSGPARHWLD
jgi:hypothetical protein